MLDHFSFRSGASTAKAVETDVSMYLEKGHTVSRIVTDSELNRHSMEHQLRLRKILLSTPAVCHEKKAERGI